MHSILPSADALSELCKLKISSRGQARPI